MCPKLRTCRLMTVQPDRGFDCSPPLVVISEALVPHFREFDSRFRAGVRFVDGQPHGPGGTAGPARRDFGRPQRVWRPAAHAAPV